VNGKILKTGVDSGHSILIEVEVMHAKSVLLFILTLIFSHLTFAQVEESHVDFTVSPSLISSGEIQVAYEWLEPSELKNKDVAVTDLHKVAALHPGKNHMVASKIAFISRRSFDELNYASMAKSSFISRMLNAVSISQKSSELWNVTNRVKAYKIPFKVSFDFRFKEASAASIGSAANYLKDEGAGLAGKGRERFMILDMTNFSQLMYRNYTIVYMKEISEKETLVVSTVVAGFNKNMADTFFNLPPFSTTKKTMMDNFETQIMQIVREIQN
jgi:hypothetical protein